MDEMDETIAERAARARRENPYFLHYTRRGGRRSGVGLSVGTRIAPSVEAAQRYQRLMEIEDEAHGHTTTYEIVERPDRER